MKSGLLWFILAAGIFLYGWSVYNQLVTIKARIRAAIQEIGNQLKRQANLIPNLVASLKGYLKHEKEVFEELTKARAAALKVIESQDAQKLMQSSARLQAALAPIRAVFESTPQLQAVGPTSRLMDELVDTADKVMYSRRTLIDLTADFNIKIVTFPSNLVAKIFGFKPEPGLQTLETGEHLEVGQEELKEPKVEI